MASTVRRRRAIDPGWVLVDLAVTLADGGDCLSDLRTLRDQPELFGRVASGPTAWRVIDSVDEAVLDALRAGRAKAGPRRGPRVALPDRITLDFDATLVTAHSEKESASATYKMGYGFHPLGCWLDETHEALAAILRPGNAGANTATDHVAVLDMALAQLPVKPTGLDPEAGVEMLARADSAGATHGFINTLRERGIKFSVGFDITEAVRVAILALPAYAWGEAIRQDCEVREGAEIAELTALLDLSSWPAGHPGDRASRGTSPGRPVQPVRPAGWRHQVFISTATTRHLPTWRPATGDTPGSRTASVAAKTPAFGTSRSTTSPPTRPGSRSSSARATCSPGPNCSASTANSPRPNRNGCATASCTPPAVSPTTPGAPCSASPATGHGPNSCASHSSGSAASPAWPDQPTPQTGRYPKARHPTRSPTQHLGPARLTTPTPPPSRPSPPPTPPTPVEPHGGRLTEQSGLGTQPDPRLNVRRITLCW